MPYTLDTNDMRFATPQGFNTGDQFFAYLRDAFDVLYAEGASAPEDAVDRPALPPRRPSGRFAALQRFLDHVAAHDRRVGLPPRRHRPPLDRPASVPSRLTARRRDGALSWRSRRPPPPAISRARALTMSDASPDDSIHAETLNAALVHHHAGRLPEAEAIYRKILDAAPDHPGALHLLGMVAFQTGRPALAQELVERAIDFDPQQPHYRHDLGDVLRSRKRYDAAAARYREAIALKPDLVAAHANLAMVLHQAGRVDDAVAAYEQALRLAPESHVLAYNAGNALKDHGTLDLAVARYRDALAIEPRFPPALFNLAAVLQMQGNYAEAIAACERLIAIEPTVAAAHFRLATLHERQGNADAAIDAYRATLALMPDFVEARNNLAKLIAQARLTQTRPPAGLIRRRLAERTLRMAVAAAISRSATARLAAHEDQRRGLPHHFSARDDEIAGTRRARGIARRARSVMQGSRRSPPTRSRSTRDRAASSACRRARAGRIGMPVLRQHP